MAPSNMLSHPPIMSRNQWKGAGLQRKFPGGNLTFLRSIAPRPLAVQMDEATVRDLQAATGGVFNTLQDTIKLPPDILRATSSFAPVPVPSAAAAASQAGGGARGSKNGQLYDSIWPDTNLPTFSNWEYCQKRGHAPPPNSLPAPRVTDIKQWFNTYGQPTRPAPPGYRTEFTSLGKSVRHCPGELSGTAKMFPGRVLC